MLFLYSNSLDISLLLKRWKLQKMIITGPYEHEALLCVGYVNSKMKLIKRFAKLRHRYLRRKVKINYYVGSH